MNKDCPTQDKWPEFLSGQTSAKEQAALELHLADCGDCRGSLALMFSEVADRENFAVPDSLKEKVKKLPATAKTDSVPLFSFKWFKIIGLEAGLATLLVVCCGALGLYLWQNRQSSKADDVWRNGSTNKNSVKLLAPEVNATLSAEKIEFRWSEIQGAKSYTLIISDEKGNIIQEISTEKPNLETSITALGLVNQKRYFWHLKVKLTDGTTAESENRKIFIAHQ